MRNTDPKKPTKVEDHQEEEMQDMEEIITDDNEDLADEMGDVDFVDYEADNESSSELEEEELIQDDAVSVFTEHTGSVFVVNIDPSEGALAVSGGEDDMAYVWDVNSGEIIIKCTGHSDSVICASFNSSSTMVATGDMAGNIKVWSLQTRTCVWEFETGELEWLKWHPLANVLVAGIQDGQCWMWKIPSGESKIFQSHGSSAACGCILPDGRTLCVGYTDGTIKLMDLKTTEVKHTIKGRDGHTSQLTQFSPHPNNNLIVSSSLDGTAKLFNSNTGKVSKTFACGKRPQNNDEESETETNSIECVGFSPKYSLFAMGSLKGDLDIYDFKTNMLRHQCPHPNGVTELAWDNANGGGSFIYTACLDNIARIWDARTGNLIEHFTGHKDHIYSIAITQKFKKMLTASADGTVRVFNIPLADNPPR